MIKKNEILWKTDSAGMVLGARAHDGILTSISLSENELSFHVKRLSGDTVLFELKGIGEFNIKLCDGAILSEVYAWKISSFPENAWVVPDNAWNVLYQERVRDVRSVAEQISRKRPTSLLIHVTCSYGGAIAVVCDRFSIYEL
jgi:hypothetical protein